MRPKLIKERKGVLNTLHAWLITDNYGHELATVHAWRSSAGIWQVDVYNATEWTGSGRGNTINNALSRASVGLVAGHAMYDDAHRDADCIDWENCIENEIISATYFDSVFPVDAIRAEKNANANGFILGREGYRVRVYRAPGLEFFRLSRNYKLFQIL